ncbi:MAG: ABC transporter ATP-binding protein, partial [Candidatus Neomarinimicrobiota bacterium]
MPNYKLELKNLTVTALPAKKILVKNVSLGVAEEGVTAILGQSGSGKTTICLS